MKVLAIDPGERVGWATGEVLWKVRPKNGEILFGVQPDETVETEKFVDLTIGSHGITALKPFALKLFEAIGGYDVVIYETYRISANHIKHHIGSDVPTLQLIGMIRAAAWLHPQVKLVAQGPATKATADRTMPDDLRERIAKLPAAHDDSHDGDALRHLAFWHWKAYG